MPALEWVNPIPSIYDPRKQKTTYVESLPSVTAPDNKNFMVRQGEYTPSQVFSKGASIITHHNSTDANAWKAAGKTCYDVQRPEHIGLTPGGGGGSTWATAPDGTRYNTSYYPSGPLTESQAYDRAASTDVSHRIAIYEAEEGESWIQPNHPQWKGWYRRIKERKAANTDWSTAGLVPLTAHNYYQPDFLNSSESWWTLAYTTKSNALAKMALPVSSWPDNRFIREGVMKDVNLIVDGIYMEPDNLMNGVLVTAWRSQVVKKMGKYFGIYMAHTYEWRPNNLCSVMFPEEDFPDNWGLWFRSNKIDLPQEKFIAYVMVAGILGDFADEWNGGGSTSSDNMDKGFYASDYYYKFQTDSSGTDTGQTFTNVPEYGSSSYLANDFPYYRSPGGGGPDLRDKIGSNYFMFGVNYYCRTFGQTAGGTLLTADYRINGGSWVTRKTEIYEMIADAFYDKGWFVLIERKAGKASICAYNEQPSNFQKVTIDIKHPVTNVIYTAEVIGSAFYAATVTE